MVTIRDSADKRTRRIVDSSKEPEPIVRVAGDVRDPVPFAEIPTALAEIIGRQVAGLRALSRSGVVLTAEELSMLSDVAKTVSSLATAHKKLVDDKPLDALTEDEIKAALAK